MEAERSPDEAPNSRNIVVCCDGTWNAPDGASSTNVVYAYDVAVDAANEGRRIVRSGKADSGRRGSLAELSDCNDPRQVLYYQTGIGTSGSAIGRALDGATGIGIRRNIIHAYRWLAANFSDADRIFVFGFSRGAYTARSLGGLIARCGLLYPDYADEADNVFELYRDRRLLGAKGHISDSLLNGKARRVDIHFMGVWDTVGALGIPIAGGNYNFLSIWRNQFHDVTLSDAVRNAYHALALDEMRPSFVPTLWQVPAERPANCPVEQVWFRGCHSDVGGGYAPGERHLANITLRWMMQKAHGCGLRVDFAHLDQICAGASEPRVHNSLGRFWRALGAWPRGCPVRERLPEPEHEQTVALDPAGPAKRAPNAEDVALDRSIGTLHESVATVKPDSDGFEGLVSGLDNTIRAVRVNGSEIARVDSRYWWNRTGIALEAGATYEMRCVGEWNDASQRCTATGWDKRDILFRLLKRFRRKRDGRWFSMIGLVNNYSFFRSREASVVKGLYRLLVEDPPELTSRQVNIGESCMIRPLRDGLLYCFANDLWWAYPNNDGAIEVHVKRVPAQAIPACGLPLPRPSVDASDPTSGEEDAFESDAQGNWRKQKAAAVTDERLEKRLGYFGAIAAFLAGLVLAIAGGVVTGWGAAAGALGLSVGLALTGWWLAPLFAPLTRTIRFVIGLVLVALLVAIVVYAPDRYAVWALDIFGAVGWLFTLGIFAWGVSSVFRTRR